MAEIPVGTRVRVADDGGQAAGMTGKVSPGVMRLHDGAYLALMLDFHPAEPEAHTWVHWIRSDRLAVLGLGGQGGHG